jgi:hypothetical protein
MRLLFALLLTSCGFIGEPPFVGTRYPDVAPWRELAPLVICDGTARLGAQRSGPLGQCERGTAPACDSDPACGSRERCVCGRCIIPACSLAEDCPAGMVCSFGDQRCDIACTGDGDCKGGERCVPGKSVCRGTCEADDQCQSGEICQRASGLCASTGCATDDECAGGRTCRLQRQPAELAEPSALADGTRVTLWFQRSAPAMPPSIWRAVSDDGVRFRVEPRRELLPGGAPSVVADGRGGFLLYFVTPGATTIQRATSADGVSFSTNPRILIAAGEAPSAVRLPDGRIALYFQIPDGASGGRSLARADSPDGSSFSLPELVLEPAAVQHPLYWRAVDRLASPVAESLVDPAGQPYVRLWFAGRGLESATSIQFGEAVPTPANFSIGEAASYDGKRFVSYPFNPVFDRVSEFLNHPSELEPSVIPYQNASLLYYRRAAADGTRSDNLAVAKNLP